MIRSGEGCIREDKSNFLVHTDFPLPRGTRDYHRKRMFEGHCFGRGHLIHRFKTIVLISHMSLKVIASAELPFTYTTRQHFVKWLP